MVGSTAAAKAWRMAEKLSRPLVVGEADYAYGVAVEPGPPARLWIDLGGSPCGQQGVVVHATMLVCSRALVWSAAKRAFDYAPLVEARPIR